MFHQQTYQLRVAVLADGQVKTGKASTTAASIRIGALLQKVLDDSYRFLTNTPAPDTGHALTDLQLFRLRAAAFAPLIEGWGAEGLRVAWL